MNQSTSTATQTGHIVVEPQLRRYARKRYLAALAGLATLSVVAYASVKEVSRVGGILEAELFNTSRIVVYELPTGARLRIPIEPNSDALRLVVHAYRRNSVLAPELRSATIEAQARGSRGGRVDHLLVQLPGTQVRVAAEDRSLVVGDPAGVHVDVHDLGVGELTLTLKQIDDADGLLVRAYRREKLSATQASRRNKALNAEQKNRLAEAVWELGWGEISDAEREVILASRWSKLGALRGEGSDLRPQPIALAPLASAHGAGEAGPWLMGSVVLRGDERVSVDLQPEAVVHAQRQPSGFIRTKDRTQPDNSRGESQTQDVFMLATPQNLTAWAEMSTVGDALLTLRSPDPQRVQWYRYAHAWRVTEQRGVRIDSLEADRIVRVGVRHPMERSDPFLSPVQARITLTMSKSREPVVQTFEAQLPRSRVDRYEGADPDEAPSDRAQFFIVMPRGSTASVHSSNGLDLDVSLAEHDSLASPDLLPVRPIDAPAPVERIVGEEGPSSFIPRKPSNGADFGIADRRQIRVGKAFIPIEPSVPGPPLVHVEHASSKRTFRNGRFYESVGPPFVLRLPRSLPALLPMAFHAQEAVQVTISVEAVDGHPARPGLAHRVTLPRVVDVGPGDWQATFAVGDDLVPGTYRLHLKVSPERPVEVHVPWVAATSAPHWIGGLFED